MIAILRFLLRSLYLLAWAVVILGAGLVVIEESGVLARALRTSVAWRLGPLGEGLEVGDVRLRWFEPGIEIQEIRLSALDSEGQPVEELLRLKSVHLSVDVALGSRPLQRLHVDGGRVHISNRLLQGLKRFAASLSERGESEIEPPPFVVSDFEIELELPGGTLDIGTVDLIASPVAGGFDLSGELRPILSGAVTGPARVQVVGSIEETRIELFARSDGITLDTADFDEPSTAQTLPLAGFSGLLSLNATGHLDFGEEFVAEGKLRARVSNARLQPRPEDPWLENLEVDIESEFHPAGDDLWARNAWDTVCRARTNWKDTPVEAWALFGKHVAPGLWARGFARAERLPHDRSTLVDLGAPPDDVDLWLAWDAFTPNGSADASIDLFVDRNRNDAGVFEYSVRGAAHVAHFGASGLTFNGFPTLRQEQPGDRLGIPMPCNEVRGQTIATFDPSRERPTWIALADLTGHHSAGTVSAWGMISDRPIPEPGLGPYLDLGFEVPEMELDAAWQTVLSESPLTRRIWDDYNPESGQLSTRWRLRDAPGTTGLTAAGDVHLEGALLAWEGLPIPMHATSGDVKIRWAARASRFTEENRPKEDGDQRNVPRGYRPYGVSFDLRNDGPEPHLGVTARVSGFVRDDDLPAEISRADVTTTPSWAVDVEIDEIGLKGQDADILAQTVTAFGPKRDELGARGKIRIEYESTQPAPSLPYEAHIRATPIQVELQPVEFNLRTRNVEGQVLMRWLVGRGEGDESLDMRFGLTGSWASGVSLGIAGGFKPSGLGEIVIVGVGVDAENPALRAAAAVAMGSQEPGARRVDLSNSSLSSFDFELTIPIDVDTAPDVEPEQKLRLFLREASLANGSLRLDRLHGVLTRFGDEMRSPRIFAELAGHPVVLSNVLVFSLEKGAELDEVDDQLLRSGFVSDKGLAFQAVIDTTHLPLDDEHLASLMDEETLAALRSSQSWQGFLDLAAAHILVTSPAEEGDDGVVVLRGSVRPHDVTLDFGLPMTITTADVDLREMVLERGSVRAWAKIDSMSGTIAGRSLIDASMILGLVDQRLTIDDLDGEFEGGRLRSLGSSGRGARKALGVDMTPPHRFDLALEAKGVDVETLMQGVFRSSIADTGELNATLELSGTPDDLLGLTGRGSMKLSKGRLWSIPAMRAVFSQLGFPNTAVFNELQSRFELRDGVIDTHYLEVKSSLLKLVGSGTLALDGDLDFDLDVRYSLLERLGILNRLIYWLNRNLMRVSVRGDFERPRVLIRSSIFEILGGSPDESRRGLPLPPFAALPPRF